MSDQYYEGFDLCSLLTAHRIARNHVYKGENVPLQLVALPILNSLYQVVIWRTGDLSLSLLSSNLKTIRGRKFKYIGVVCFVFHVILASLSVFDLFCLSE